MADSRIDDGGLAFPQTGGFDSEGNFRCSQAYEYGDGGMTLRDWFAGQALAVLDVDAIAVGMAGSTEPNRAAKTAAKMAYNIADAMISKRKA
jgi:hypothetical protein